MQAPITFIVDFDSTIIKVEAIEELARIALYNTPNADALQSEIQSLTDRAMEGTLSFREALRARLALLNAKREHMEQLKVQLPSQLTDSVKNNKTFFDQYGEQIYIVSSGFRECILPIAQILGIPDGNVYANTLIWDANGDLIGFDETNVLSEDFGKVKLISQLDLKGEVIVVGDGYTDYQVKEAGFAHKFVAFAENVQRTSVMEKSDLTVMTLDELLYEHDLPRNFSFPKSKIKVLLLEGIHSDACEILKKEGYQVESLPQGLEEEELCEAIKGVSILGIRSKTMVTEKVIQAADRLLAVGAFCIGTNQIQLNACMQRGIAVFNAPYSNTRSVVELAIGEMILLMRFIPRRSHLMHKGVWEKSAKNSFEIRGKKLGIVGYGNIGAQLSVLAEAMGMEVYFYDVVDKLALGNARQCKSLEELLQVSDIVTLHVDGRKENTGLIGSKEFEKMKEGVVFLNLARGSVVDLTALKDAIESGKVRGAAVDVFPEEPKSNDESFESILCGLPNVILSPHVGGSTQEAQRNIAAYVPGKIIDYINSGNTFASVNLPNLQLPTQGEAHRLLHIHSNMPGILAQINQVLAKFEANILGQYLKTNEQIGYVITDINQAYSPQLIQALKEIPHTIRMRVLY